MANFVRDNIVLDIPDAQLSLLKTCFDKADDKIMELSEKIDSMSVIKLGRKKYLADSGVLDFLAKAVETLRQATGNLKAKKSNDQDEVDNEVTGDELLAEINRVATQIAELKAKQEVLVKELEKQQQEQENVKSVIAERVKDRRQLERKILKLLDMSEDEIDEKSSRELKEELLVQRYGYTLEQLATKTDEEINAMFEIATLQAEMEKTPKQLLEPIQQDRSESEIELAYKQYTAQVKDAWQVVINNKERV